jgi:hypothetical protein
MTRSPDQPVLERNSLPCSVSRGLTQDGSYACGDGDGDDGAAKDWRVLGTDADPTVREALDL